MDKHLCIEYISINNKGLMIWQTNLIYLEEEKK